MKFLKWENRFRFIYFVVEKNNVQIESFNKTINKREKLSVGSLLHKFVIY